MSLYKHLDLQHAATIIACANKGMNIYQIFILTKISKGKIKRCLEAAKVVVIKARINHQWKKPRVIITYSIEQYKKQRDYNKAMRAFNYADECVKVYKLFIYFCKELYEKPILGKRVKRSADEFIKEFKKAFPNETCPSRDWVYKMANSHHYEFEIKWLPSSKPKVYKLKSDDESKKPLKYNPLTARPNKVILITSKGNFEIDSVIGKRTDKQAILSLKNMQTNVWYSHFYNRTSLDFMKSLKYLMERFNLQINTLTMDNGGENNKLHEIIDQSKLFNCRPYCSGDKGSLENIHRLVRRIIPKGESMDKYENKDLDIIMDFVNNYYSGKYGNALK